jgi:transcription antitermination factor NusG
LAAKSPALSLCLDTLASAVSVALCVVSRRASGRLDASGDGEAVLQIGAEPVDESEAVDRMFRKFSADRDQVQVTLTQRDRRSHPEDDIKLSVRKCERNRHGRHNDARGRQFQAPMGAALARRGGPVSPNTALTPRPLAGPPSAFTALSLLARVEDRRDRWHFLRPLGAGGMQMPYWSVVRTEPQRDKLAVLTIRQAGFVLFAPKIRVPFRKEPVLLFCNYLFVLIEAQWRAIERAPGVSHLVKFDDSPARIQDRDIEALRARSDEDGVVRLQGPPPAPKRRYAAGQRVKITGGSLSGFSALHSGMSAAEREIVLIQMLGGERRVAVPGGFVEPVVA